MSKAGLLYDDGRFSAEGPERLLQNGYNLFLIYLFIPRWDINTRCSAAISEE